MSSSTTNWFVLEVEFSFVAWVYCAIVLSTLEFPSTLVFSPRAIVDWFDDWVNLDSSLANRASWVNAWVEFELSFARRASEANAWVAFELSLAREASWVNMREESKPSSARRASCCDRSISLIKNWNLQTMTWLEFKSFSISKDIK